ncbi:glycosyltransferase family 2 protein [Mucilaginibacter segetis]|uniref:Glycosyltransferase family 2 protein n=1 Tax=Mucilaginibacter segetis TaxID=2793071 RepID=A0A934PQE9_9SPHI|nr:glycosyltransferase family 2 protein [Mucilaginibacter segetis]MBK0378194.1 glycosyltransferase family 2 protein [Mucilaginibacter segetis]
MESINKINSQPLVSIIIPAYNASAYIQKAIISAIDQSWRNKEIIIIDDGSTDNTLTVAKYFECETVHVFHQENTGASAARNFGLSKAKGEYVQFLDADDILSLDKIEEQVNTLLKNPCKIAVCSTVHFFDGEDHLSCKPSQYEESYLINADPVKFLIKLWGGYDENGSMVQPNAWLTPMSLIQSAGLWNEELTLDDDGEFFARVILASEGVIKSKGLNYYRKYKSRNNLSSQTNTKDIESAVKSTLLKKQYILKCTNNDTAKKAVFTQLINLCHICYGREHNLYKIVKKELKTVPQYRYNHIVGGTLINKIAIIFGWKTAKILQLIYHKITIIL